jgi:hypothetical protein
VYVRQTDAFPEVQKRTASSEAKSCERRPQKQRTNLQLFWAKAGPTNAPQIGKQRGDVGGVVQPCAQDVRGYPKQDGFAGSIPVLGDMDEFRAEPHVDGEVADAAGIPPEACAEPVTLAGARCETLARRHPIASSVRHRRGWQKGWRTSSLFAKVTMCPRPWTCIGVTSSRAQTRGGMQRASVRTLSTVCHSSSSAQSLVTRAVRARAARVLLDSAQWATMSARMSGVARARCMLCSAARGGSWEREMT